MCKTKIGQTIHAGRKCHYDNSKWNLSAFQNETSRSTAKIDRA